MHLVKQTVNKSVHISSPDAHAMHQIFPTIRNTDTSTDDKWGVNSFARFSGYRTNAIRDFTNPCTLVSASWICGPFLVLLHAFDIFFIWMLHGSTKVVVRAVALLSAKTKDKVANSLKKWFRESNNLETNEETNTNHIAVSRRVQGRVGVACSSDG